MAYLIKTEIFNSEMRNGEYRNNFMYICNVILLPEAMKY